MNVVRIYVGADRSQALAVKVLEHSIKRHSSLQVEVIPMVDLNLPIPKDLRNSQRTGFSFSRFCIPSLADYRGKAIYMDADMQVFKDIRNLWEIRLGNARVAIQSDITNDSFIEVTPGRIKKRIKQSAVMILDCSKLDWNISQIIEGLNNNDYDYEKLMYEFCILKEDEIAYVIPKEWNSLEHYDENTCLLHYTDMGTQPWVSTKNKNGEIWLQEVRLMLSNGSLRVEELDEEIRLGYFRPSLRLDIKIGHKVPALLKPFYNFALKFFDRILGFIPHRAVYATKKKRDIALTHS